MWCSPGLRVRRSVFWSSANMDHFLHYKTGTMTPVQGCGGGWRDNKWERTLEGKTFSTNATCARYADVGNVSNFLGGNVTYISMDNIQIACLCHNLGWFHTRAIHLIAQRSCNLHTTCFQTWMEMHRLPHWHCPAACTCLEETYRRALRMSVNLLKVDFPIRRMPKEDHTWGPHPGNPFFFPFCLYPSLFLSTHSSLYQEQF